jgi:hypothetical protein
MRKNLTENHTIPMVEEIHAKQSINEENSSLFMKSILKKGKYEGRYLRSDKPQNYVQKQVFRIRIRIRMFLGLLGPSINKQTMKKNIDFYCFVISF